MAGAETERLEPAVPEMMSYLTSVFMILYVHLQE